MSLEGGKGGKLPTLAEIHIFNELNGKEFLPKMTVEEEIYGFALTILWKCYYLILNIIRIMLPNVDQKCQYYEGWSQW